MEDEDVSDLEHGLALSLMSFLFLSSVLWEGITGKRSTLCPPSLAGTWIPAPISDPHISLTASGFTVPQITLLP